MQYKCADDCYEYPQRRSLMQVTVGRLEASIGFVPEASSRVPRLDACDEARDACATVGGRAWLEGCRKDGR